MIQIHNGYLIFLPGNILYSNASVFFQLVYGNSQAANGTPATNWTDELNWNSAVKQYTNMIPLTQATTDPFGVNNQINSIWWNPDGVGPSTNTSINLGINGSVPITGNGILKVKVWYSVIDTI